MLCRLVRVHLYNQTIVVNRKGQLAPRSLRQSLRDLPERFGGRRAAPAVLQGRHPQGSPAGVQGRLGWSPPGRGCGGPADQTPALEQGTGDSAARVIAAVEGLRVIM